ncbi:MAG: hypothetical protein AAB638_00590 [Patescibacteria group bacterium]
MRPIWWGVIFFVIGILGWVAGVVFAVVSVGKLRLLPNIFGIIAIISLPIALIAELARKKNRV